MKTVNKAITIPILNNEYKVVVCWGDNKFIDKQLSLHYHKLTIEETNFMNSCRAITCYEDRCYPVIVLHNRPRTAEEIGTLAHEATHAVKYIFDYIKELNIDEVFAHSVGSIVREVLTIKDGK